MKKMNSHEIGMVVGATFALMHLAWSVLVMMGWATGLIDFMLSLHFLSNPYTVQIFDMGKALTLVVVTFGVGYVLGWVFASMWNTVMKRSR